jgi:hypothetical protein
MPESVEAVLRRIEDQQQDSIAVSASANPLDFLMAIYRDPQQPMNRRLRAAIEAAPYMHPKLAVTASIHTQNFAVLLEARVQRVREAKAKLVDVTPNADTPKLTIVDR